jgi:FtsZ-interacting cell division protein ZipA
MSVATVAALRGEIARLEKELNLHRRALQILEGKEGGGASKAARPATQPPKKAPKSVAAKGQAKKGTPKPAPAVAQGEQPSVRMLLQEFLSARAPQMFTPNEIAQELLQRGHKVNRDNIQRRLSDLIKTKTVIRKDSRYGAPQ